MTKEGKDAFLHDPDDPEKAAEVLDLVPENSSGACVLIGMGLGYIIHSLLEQRRSIRHLAVFDLNMNAFKQALKVRDFTTILADKRLILSFDPDPDVAKSLNRQTKRYCWKTSTDSSRSVPFKPISRRTRNWKHRFLNSSAAGTLPATPTSGLACDSLKTG